MVIMWHKSGELEITINGELYRYEGVSYQLYEEVFKAFGKNEDTVKRLLHNLKYNKLLEEFGGTLSA